MEKLCIEKLARTDFLTVLANFFIELIYSE